MIDMPDFDMVQRANEYAREQKRIRDEEEAWRWVLKIQKYAQEHGKLPDYVISEVDRYYQGHPEKRAELEKMFEGYIKWTWGPKKKKQKYDNYYALENDEATILYIIVMIVGALFNARWVIWIGATYAWYMHITRFDR